MMIAPTRSDNAIARQIRCPDDGNETVYDYNDFAFAVRRPLPLENVEDVFGQHHFDLTLKANAFTTPFKLEDVAPFRSRHTAAHSVVGRAHKPASTRST